LIAEALEIHPDAFTKVLKREYPYSLLRVGAYPQMDPSKPTAADIQGVGPHKDGSFLTYLLQGTGHSSLEVQNKSGAWISAPPIPNTLVVNIGRSLEALTQGVCVATTHRVNLKPAQYLGADNIPLGKRLSFAFFQHVALDVTKEDMRVELPPHILAFRENDVKSDAETFFNDLFDGPAGEALLTNCITSYPELGRRWYPEILAKMLEQQHKAKVLDDAKLPGKSQTV
jgi:isopenicillin N synthase-like dioxygenase